MDIAVYCVATELTGVPHAMSRVSRDQTQILRAAPWDITFGHGCNFTCVIYLRGISEV
jgi:hypothetical protein